MGKSIIHQFTFFYQQTGTYTYTSSVWHSFINRLVYKNIGTLYCVEGRWVLITFNFDTNSVVVWNTIGSNEAYMSETITVIDMWKAFIVERLDQSDIQQWHVVWDQSVQ